MTLDVRRPKIHDHTTWRALGPGRLRVLRYAMGVLRGANRPGYRNKPIFCRQQRCSRPFRAVGTVELGCSASARDRAGALPGLFKVPILDEE